MPYKCKQPYKQAALPDPSVVTRLIHEHTVSCNPWSAVTLPVTASLLKKSPLSFTSVLVYKHKGIYCCFLFLVRRLSHTLPAAISCHGPSPTLSAPNVEPLNVPVVPERVSSLVPKLGAAAVQSDGSLTMLTSPLATSTHMILLYSRGRCAWQKAEKTCNLFGLSQKRGIEDIFPFQCPGVVREKQSEIIWYRKKCCCVWHFHTG